ncbi:hypothetical protein V8J36_10510 [Frigidibacter sp. MR17.14]|uniref:hypothetical protein n=1 Tax=Frigidibacter sp. MR17.14 TaxID=3126509 RepID=UPI003012A8C0
MIIAICVAIFRTGITRSVNADFVRAFRLCVGLIPEAGAVRSGLGHASGSPAERPPRASCLA